MWTENELDRIRKSFIKNENKLEDFCDKDDLGIFT